MKKTIIGITLLAATVLTASVNVNAEETANKKEAPKTDVGIGFKGDTNINEGPYKGNLTLIHNPGTFDFGKANTATNGANIFEQLKAKDAKTQYLSVFDDRADDQVKKGWKLTTGIETLSAVGDATTVLNGNLEMRFTKPKKYVLDVMNDKKTDWLIKDPSTATEDSTADKFDFAFEDTFGVDGLSNKAVEVPIATGSEVPVMSAKVDGARDGVLTSIDGVKLNVTNGQKANTQYTGVLNWTLNDTY